MTILYYMGFILFSMLSFKAGEVIEKKLPDNSQCFEIRYDCDTPEIVSEGHEPKQGIRGNK